MYVYKMQSSPLKLEDARLKQNGQWSNYLKFFGNVYWQNIYEKF
jgi:hypothetical protein